VRTGERRRFSDRRDGAAGWRGQCVRETSRKDERKSAGQKSTSKSWRGLTCLLAACAVIGVGARLAGDPRELRISTSAQAQQGQQQFKLNVAPVMLAEPATRSPFPIQVGPSEALVRNSFVRIRGLPTAAILSEGHSISPGAWAVPLAGLASLGITLPVGLQGRWDASVALVTIEGTVLTEARTVLVVGPVQLIAPQQQAKEPPKTSVASLGPTPTALDSPPATAPSTAELDRALGLHAKGKELLEQGNIQPARMLFRRAAEQGLAESALALGSTYDPVELSKLKVMGLQPDIAAARQWYDKARELGAAEATDRLRRLDNR